MSNNQQSRNNQNQQRQGGTPTQQQQTNNSQSTRNGGEASQNLMNAPVGNQRAQQVNPTSVQQTVGQIPGVAPTTTTRTQPQQIQQGTGGQFGQPTASQPPMVMQGNNPGPGAYGSQPQAMNVGQPQQPVYNPQGQQQFRFRTPMTPSNQQGQAGSTSIPGVGFGRGAPSYGPGTGGTGSASWFRSDPFRDAGMGRGGQPGDNRGNPPQRRG